MENNLYVFVLRYILFTDPKQVDYFFKALKNPHLNYIKPKVNLSKNSSGRSSGYRHRSVTSAGSVRKCLFNYFEF